MTVKNDPDIDQTCEENERASKLTCGLSFTILNCFSMPVFIVAWYFKIPRIILSKPGIFERVYCSVTKITLRDPDTPTSLRVEFPVFPHMGISLLCSRELLQQRSPKPKLLDCREWKRVVERTCVFRSSGVWKIWLRRSVNVSVWTSGRQTFGQHGPVSLNHDGPDDGPGVYWIGRAEQNGRTEQNIKTDR